MSVDKKSEEKMSVDKMVVYKMFVDKKSEQEMSVEEIVVDKLSVYHMTRQIG